MLNSGTLLQNRYQILQRIGGGGMGDVYLAHDLRLGNRQVVVKENRGGDPQLFYAEANILANLHHANLPNVSDHFIEPNQSQYLVMTFIAGQTLEQVVQTHGALLEQNALAWFAQILDAVKYLHANRIVHRDIKPQNIIITPDGSAVLVDFGIAKVMQPGNATLSGARGFGSPGYAPPEQYTGGTDERSDIYSLGGTMYFALTGTDPLSVPERASGNAMPPMRQRNSSVSANTEHVIAKAMALAISQRYQSAAEMEQALQPRASSGNKLWLVVALAGAGAIMLFVLVMVLIPFINNLKPTVTATLVALAPTLATSPAIVPTQTPFIVTATPIPTSTAMPTLRITATLIPRAGEMRIFTPDNAPMVYVPAGNFKMGNDGGYDGKPVHTVTLDAFWIDKYEVTNALYKRCLDADKCSAPSDKSSYTRPVYYGNSQYDDFPVIHVSWDDADKYCAWAGKRLPTEAEWEKAARGTDGRIYPWGNDWDGTKLNSWVPPPNDTTAVGSYPNGASPYGAMDMVGNVWEWVADWYDRNYYASSPSNNPKGPSSGQYHVLRGGSLGSLLGPNYAKPLASERIEGDSYENYDHGIRCAQ